MRFYDCTTAPSPRRVRIFLAEKGMEIPTVQIALAEREQFSPEFRAHNAYCTVPLLDLDDGTCIHESVAICRYIEESHPEPPLMGNSPKSKALVEMWNRHMEMDGFLAVVEAFRNKASGFTHRALPGPRPVEQIPALVARGTERYRHFLEDLNLRLGETEFVAGDAYSIADITALVAVDFGARALKIAPGAEQAHLRRWHEEMSSRPSASA